MFDTIILDIECPNCKKTSLIECQTKDLCCELMNLHKGDYLKQFLDKKDTQLYCIADCQSSECYSKPESWTGLSLSECRIKRTYFRLNVEVKDFIITGNYEIIKNSIDA